MEQEIYAEIIKFGGPGMPSWNTLEDEFSRDWCGHAAESIWEGACYIENI